MSKTDYFRPREAMLCSMSALNERRSHERISEKQAIAIIDNIEYPLVDWNKKGVLIHPFEGRYYVGSLIHLGITIPFRRIDFSFFSAAKVVRRNNESKDLAATFVDLDPEIIDKISSIARSKIWI